MIYLHYLAAYVAIGIVLTLILYWSYVFVMGLKRVRDRKTLTPLAYYLSWPVMAVGLLADVLVNQLYMSVICFDFLHFGTVTSRMQRYKHGDATPWQKKVSAFVEFHIDDFDDSPGGHI